MFEEFIKNLIWLDILLLVILVRGLFLGVKNGIFIEFFKLFEIVAVTVVTLHYYLRLAVILNNMARLPLVIGEALSFLSLWLIVGLIFKLVRDGLMILIKVEANAAIDKWGGTLIAVVRSLLLCSLIVVFLQVSGVDYLKNYAQRSYLGPYIFQFAPSVYASCYKNLLTKFFPEEKINSKAFLVDVFERKEKK